SLKQVRYGAIKEGSWEQRLLRHKLPRFEKKGLFAAPESGMRALPDPYSTTYDTETEAIREKVERFKPEGVVDLEKALSEVYVSQVTVINVDVLSQSRKEVKRVTFHVNDRVSKVWVFKAEPEATARELALYHIIHKSGIPTARPIGYTPEKGGGQYPFDVAILGGIVSHAGDAYKDLLRDISPVPDLAFSTSIAVAELIASYQVKLSQIADEFAEFGIEIAQASPGKELKERFFPVVGVLEDDSLTAACERLYARLSSDRVISHGDTHLGNVVTVKKDASDVSPSGLSTKEFGLIDWETICYDHPYSDVVDFWLHHEREVRQWNPHYNRKNGRLQSAFQMRLEEEALSDGQVIRLEEKDWLIMDALWNLYEVFDPTRTELVEQKATYHARKLLKTLGKLEKTGARDEALAVRKELQPYFQSKEFLQRFL
ncbi:MAG: aminoglycoside phosphotransferase family protein, partial [Nanoarchaeota archaeon]